ncbi:MAG: class I SAM-dependent methyltransferase, partial [Planctomycetota bacterium]
MADRGNKAYLQPYRQAVERHGPGFEATLWHSVEAQVLRFDIMIGLVDLEGRSVLDAGCGQGDFAARLLERGVPFARFVGVDALAEMVEAA